MAHLVLVGTALLAGRTMDARGRVLALLCLLGIPLFAFYSKTSNVDIAYLFWLVVVALAFVRAMSSRTLRDHVLLGAAAAATIATKDQAYGFFPGCGDRAALAGLARLVPARFVARSPGRHNPRSEIRGAAC